MENVQILVGILLLAGISALIWQNLRGKKGENRDFVGEIEKFRAENEVKTRELGEKLAENEGLKKEKAELTERGKIFFVENEKVKSENKNIRENLQNAEKKIAKFEHEKDVNDKNIAERIEKLENARENLESERVRVVREDEEKMENERAERMRRWNEHENVVAARLRELCQKPEFGFNFFDNTNLPAEWDGSLKPDFLVEFLGQFVIFDAKFSEKDISGYVQRQFESTAKKVKKSSVNEKIYPAVFLVVPSDLVGEVRKTHAVEGGMDFFVISIDALAPTLASFKKIESYDIAETLDPRDREAIVDVIARYEHFIRGQNAANIVLAERASEVLDARDGLAGDFSDAVETKKAKMSPLALRGAEVRKVEARYEERVRDLTEPRRKIERGDVEVEEGLF